MPGFVVPGAGGGHKKAVNSRVEVFHNYFWQIINLFEDQGWAESETPLIALRDCTLPTFTVNKESYVASSLEYKTAKSVTWEDIKVTWYDSDGLLDIMKRWRSSVWTPEFGISVANVYKKQSSLEYYSPTGLSVCHWTLKNSWPSQIRHGDLTYTNSDVKLIEVTITYDWAIENNVEGAAVEV